MAIEADSTWKEHDERAGLDGLKAARAIGILSYRTYETFAVTQNEKKSDVTDQYRAATYMSYQGKKLASRFNAFSYWVLTQMMDRHNVARGRTSLRDALQQITARTLVLGIANDILFPIEEQKLLAGNIPSARLEILTSLYGHDGFLVETEQVLKTISKFYQDKKEKIWA